MTQQHQSPVQPSAPAPSAPKTRRTPPYTIMIGIGLGGILAAVIALVIVFGVLPTSNSGTTAGPSTHTVVYQADASGARGARSGDITLRTADGGTSQQAGVGLPLMTKAGDTGLTYSGFKPGDFVYLSIRNADSAGSVTCRILVDGNVISENTSSGAYTIATCSSRVPR